MGAMPLMGMANPEKSRKINTAVYTVPGLAVCKDFAGGFFFEKKVLA